MWPYVVFRQCSADEGRCAKPCIKMPERISRNPDKCEPEFQRAPLPWEFECASSAT